MNKRQKMTYFKRVVTIILVTALIDLQFCIFKELENLAIALLTHIIGVVFVYAVKAFLGKREEERVRLQEEQAQYDRDFERVDL